MEVLIIGCMSLHVLPVKRKEALVCAVGVGQHMESIRSCYEKVRRTCKAFTESLCGGVLDYCSKECMLDITDMACIFLTEIKKKLRRSLPRWA